MDIMDPGIYIRYSPPWAGATGPQETPVGMVGMGNRTWVEGHGPSRKKVIVVHFQGSTSCYVEFKSGFILSMKKSSVVLSAVSVSPLTLKKGVILKGTSKCPAQSKICV